MIIYSIHVHVYSLAVNSGSNCLKVIHNYYYYVKNHVILELHEIELHVHDSRLRIVFVNYDCDVLWNYSRLIILPPLSTSNLKRQNAQLLCLEMLYKWFHRPLHSFASGHAGKMAASNSTSVAGCSMDTADWLIILTPKNKPDLKIII